MFHDSLGVVEVLSILFLDLVDVHWKANAASGCNSEKHLVLFVPRCVNVFPLLLVSEDSHLSISETFFFSEHVIFNGNHFVETNDSIFFTERNSVKFVHVRWNVHEIGSFVHSLGNIVCDLGAILEHGDDGLQLVLRGQANITKTEDVLMNDEISWIVVGSNWMLVSDTTFRIHPDLA